MNIWNETTFEEEMNEFEIENIVKNIIEEKPEKKDEIYNIISSIENIDEMYAYEVEEKIYEMLRG